MPRITDLVRFRYAWMRIFCVLIFTLSACGPEQMADPVTPTNTEAVDIPQTLVPTSEPTLEAQPTQESIPTSLPETGASATPAPEIIDPENAQDLVTVEQVAPVRAERFAWADLTGLLALATENQVAVFSPAQEKVVGQLGTEPANQLTSLPALGLVAWATQDQTVHVWSEPEQRELQTILDAGQPISGLAFSPDGSQVIASTTDAELKAWNIADGQLAHACALPNWLMNLAVSPEESQVAGVDPPNFTIYFLDRATCEQIRTLTWSSTASPALYGVFFSPDWKTVAWVARGTVQLMDVGSGKEGPQLSHEDFVNGVAWSPDGKILATAAAATVDGRYSPVVILWDAATGQVINTLTLSTSASSLSFSPDGRELAILLSGGNLQFWAVKP